MVWGTRDYDACNSRHADRVSESLPNVNIKGDCPCLLSQPHSQFPNVNIKVDCSPLTPF
jgi:hypothetical protein